jgi:hypothetical protein
MEITVKLSAAGQEQLKSWKEYALDGGCDIFRSRQYSAYWAMPVSFQKGKGWLLCEMDNEERTEDERETAHEEATALWKDNLPLPAGYYAFGAEQAEAAFRVGLVHKGESWYENGDADDYDYVVQMTLLGEMRYG